MKRFLNAILALACVLLVSCGGGAGGFAGLGGGGGSGGGGGGAGGGGGGGGGGGPGSGGTGVFSVFVGSIDGFGSIIVNGVHHDISGATISTEGGSSLQLGMTTRVTGTSTDGLNSSTATQVVSAADLRGTVSGINTGDGTDGTFEVTGILVATDSSTIYDGAGLTDITALANGDNVQIYGLPGAAGTLRATRIERLAASAAPVVSGSVTSLDTASRTFVLGSLTVDFSAATFVDGLAESTLANGQIVRVRALAAPVGAVLQATQMQLWYEVPATDGTPLGLAGLVTDFSSLGAFKVMGTTVDASAAIINGGPSGSIGNGVKVEVTGTMSGGVLVATKVRIRHVPGTGGPARFDVAGAVGNYTSAANFRVQGQRIDASGPGVVFTNGTAGDLANGVRVAVTGSHVVSGILIADQVTFE